MHQHRYILEPYNGMKSRYRCPQCKIEQVFNRYIDIETNQYLAHHVGRCNREIKCAYHYTPKLYFQDNPMETIPIQTKLIETELVESVTSFVPIDVFNKSFQPEKDFELIMISNNFIKYLHSLFDANIIKDLINTYQIGTSKHWEGATVFWQTDIKGEIRTGKIMLYNASTGKRVKEPHIHITWVHKALKLENYNLQQCLFGEHLLRLPQNEDKTVAIVESEKTAIIASIYIPQFLWLATGGLNNLTKLKCNVLHKRNVILYPDLSAYNKWKEKAIKESLVDIFNYSISDILELKAPESDKLQGYDLADYLIKSDYRILQGEWDRPKPMQSVLSMPIDNTNCYQDVEVVEVKQTKNNFLSQLSTKEPIKPWEIQDLETFFISINLPTEPIQINNFSIIENAEIFISTHLEIVKAQNGKKTFLQYYERLQELKNYLINRKQNVSEFVSK